MKNAWITMLVAVMSVILTLFVVFLFLTPKLSLNVVETACNGNCVDADTIQVAMQLGRLDIVSMILGLLAISIAVFAIFGFLAVKEKAELEAKTVAEKLVRDWLTKTASKIVGREVSKLMKIYEEEMPEEKANSIMEAFSNDDDSDSGEKK